MDSNYYTSRSLLLAKFSPAVFFSLISFFTAFSQASEPLKKAPIGINEKLGQTLNLDYSFFDAHGDSINIAELVNRPTVFCFVYYTCPSICSPLLNGLQDVLNKVDLKPGKDFNVITLSINKDEKPALALQKKTNYFNRMTRDFPGESWRWLTGDSTNIEGMTREAGFAFRRTGKDFAHPAALMVLSADGKITRYLYGITFNQFDLKLALLEASQGRVGATIAKVIKFCFSYDPQGRTYAFNFMKISATIVILFGIIFFLILVIKNRKNKVQGSPNLLE